MYAPFVLVTFAAKCFLFNVCITFSSDIESANSLALAALLDEGVWFSWTLLTFRTDGETSLSSEVSSSLLFAGESSLKESICSATLFAFSFLPLFFSPFGFPSLLPSDAFFAGSESSCSLFLQR